MVLHPGTGFDWSGTPSCHFNFAVPTIKAVALGAGNPGTGFDEIVRTEAPVPLLMGLYDLGCLTRGPA